MSAHIDHLVIAARTLAEGVAWCEATLGVTPGPGGAHPLMGTHNRLLNISTEDFAQAYLEIIAIDPTAKPTRAAGLHRWFDLDDAALQAALAQRGPRLIHFVARVPDARAALQALAQGSRLAPAKDAAHTTLHNADADADADADLAPGPRIDRGALIDASRDTPAGRLNWQITVRDDGQRLFDGTLPTLIAWGPVHPVDAMPASGVALRSMQLRHPRATDLAAALAAIDLPSLPVSAGPPNLVAALDTPRGTVTLESKGL